MNPNAKDIPNTNNGPFPSVGLNAAILAFPNHLDTGNPKYPPNIIPHIIVDIPPIPMINNNCPLPFLGFLMKYIVKAAIVRMRPYIASDTIIPKNRK